jgi:hypothetical protein
VGMAVQMTGALLVLSAFSLAQVRVLTTSSLAYLLLNLVGSLLLAGNAAAGQQWGFVLLNTVWGSVTLWSLVRLATGRSAPATPGPA